MKKDEPFISIVVPTYNRAELIPDTLRSLLEQNYKNYEILIIDDGSTDNTVEVVNAIDDPRIQFIKKNNAERAAARNFGAALAKGEYVNFFDSDDLALPNHLSEAADLISRFNQPKWFHLAYSWAEPGGKVFRDVNTFTGQTLNHLMPKGNPLSCNGVFIRKDITIKHQFNEDRELSASEDYELWLRLAASYPLYYSNNITSLVIDHEGRSVRTINGQKLIRRLDLLLHYLQQDHHVMNYYKDQFNMIRMDAHSYIALHLANVPAFKIKSINYLFKAFADTPKVLRNKRFYATIKNILIKW